MSLLLAAAALAGAAWPAHAQDATATQTMNSAMPAMAPMTTTDDAWRFGVTVPLWAPGIDGNVTIRGVQQDLNVSFDQLKDHLDASFALGLDARKGKFGLYAGVGYLKFSGEYPAGYNGQASSELKLLVADAGLSYLLVKTESEHPFVLEGTAGIRYWHTESDLTITGLGGVSGDNKNDIVDPVFGLRGSQYFTRKFHLDFAGDFGGFDINNDTDWTWSATGLLTYDFAKWFSLSAGYKALALDESQGSGTGKRGLDLIFNGVMIAAKFKF
jgi:opacity protein-like surface antigen